MDKLTARKTAKMSDGRVFITEGQEYQVIRETTNALNVSTELSGEHTFFKNPESKAFYGKYFILEGEAVEAPTPVEEVKEAAPEIKEEVKAVKNQYNKRRK